ASVNRSAAQADNHRQVLNADWALILARSAGRALKKHFLRNRRAQDSRFIFASILVQIGAHSERNQFRVQFLTCIVRGAVFGTAATLDAGISLQSGDLRDVFTRNESKILIA